jgi:hypothetical protein
VQATLDDLIEVWGSIVNAYVHPSAYTSGVSSPDALYNKANATWDRVQASLDDLKLTLRKELAREPRAEKLTSET